jgi:beta-galactosidase
MNTKMGTNKWYLLLALVCQFTLGHVVAKAQQKTLSTSALENVSRSKILFDENWLFQKGDVKGADAIDFKDASWHKLDLPHDWSIEGAFDKNNPGGGDEAYLPTGIGWYRKHFYVPATMLKHEIKILFDGIYMNSDVWINGHPLGHHPSGYTPVYYDIAPYLEKGNNVIAVRVDNSLQSNTRWYTGSGIYRNVWLIITGKLHIAYQGIYVTTPVVTPDSGLVDVAATIRNDFQKEQTGSLVSVLIDKNGHEIARATKSFTVHSTSDTVVKEQIAISNPKRWSLESPYLYTLRTIVQQEKKSIDVENVRIGIREIKYDTNLGFSLNGVQTKMKGVCLHENGGVVGSAVPIGIWQRRLKILKSMGVNAIRASHNPPDPGFLDLCDQMGFLVMDEAFDAWTEGKRDYDYHLYFDKWYKQDLSAMLLRDRNHPSIVLWSVGNEIPEQSEPEGVEILKKLVDICHCLDSTRPVTSACDKIADDQHPTSLDFTTKLDIVGYNYVDRWHKNRELYYGPDKIKFPDRKMIGTEDESVYGVRGYYSLGQDSTRVNPNYTFNMINSEQLWKFIDTHDYVIGDFIWTGIDYLGESFWPATEAASGALDICGFKKDAYYFYKSQWSDQPVLHLFPHWNWPTRKGQVIPVLAYTNCDTVDLYLNGKFYGEKRLAFPRQGTSGGWNHYDKPLVPQTTADLHLQWDVPYEPGELIAVGKKEGTTITDTIRTAGKAFAIQVKIDHDTITANNQDVVHVTCEIVDKDGYINPLADNLIHFSVKGQGKLIGVGSGNPFDHESHKASMHKAFHGLCLAIIQATRGRGDITVDVSSEGLKPLEVTIQSIQNPFKDYDSSILTPK